VERVCIVYQAVVCTAVIKYLNLKIKNEVLLFYYILLILSFKF